MLKKDNTLKVTFSYTETTLFYYQQLYGYLNFILTLPNSKIFRFSPNSEKMVNL